MDDFRVGSVPSSEPYGDRHPYGSVARKRQKHRDGQSCQQQDDDADTFEADAAGQSSAAAAGEIEDYYLPSDSRGDAE
jgi:hypothetical protein